MVWVLFCLFCFYFLLYRWGIGKNRCSQTRCWFSFITASSWCLSAHNLNIHARKTLGSITFPLPSQTMVSTEVDHCWANLLLLHYTWLGPGNTVQWGSKTTQALQFGPQPPHQWIIRKSPQQSRVLNLETEPPANMLVPRSRKRGLLLNLDLDRGLGSVS